MLLLADALPHASEGFFETISPGALAGLVLFFLVLNGFFVAMEFALVAVRKTKVEEMAREGSRRSAAVLRGKEHVDNFVAAGQLGITVASLILGAAGEALFRVPLREMGLSHPVALTLLSLVAMTMFHVVVGEQVPKMLAIHDPLKVAMWTVPATEFFLRVCRPAIWVLSKMTSSILRLVGIQAQGGSHEGGELHSEEEIQALLGLRESAGLSEQAESEMIARVFSFFDMVATQVMVPRTEMCSIEATASLKEMVEMAAENRHERYPVYGKDLDDIKGVVLLKDVVEVISKDGDMHAPVSSLMREVLCVPGSLSVSQLMSQMRRSRTRIAIVLDEFGGTAGMVTYGDMLERIMGEEVEEASPANIAEPDDIEELAENRWRISGLLLIEDFEDHFNVEIEDEHNDTIGGSVFSLIGRKPQEGDEVDLAGFHFQVESLQGLRIDRLLVEKASREVSSED